MTPRLGLFLELCCVYGIFLLHCALLVSPYCFGVYTSRWMKTLLTKNPLLLVVKSGVSTPLDHYLFIEIRIFFFSPSSFHHYHPLFSSISISALSRFSLLRTSRKCYSLLFLAFNLYCVFDLPIDRPTDERANERTIFIWSDHNQTCNLHFSLLTPFVFLIFYQLPTSISISTLSFISYHSFPNSYWLSFFIARHILLPWSDSRVESEVNRYRRMEMKLLEILLFYLIPLTPSSIHFLSPSIRLSCFFYIFLPTFLCVLCCVVASVFFISLSHPSIFIASLEKLTK